MSVTRRSRRMIEAYHMAGATEPLCARAPHELGLPRSWIFNRLIDRGVFVPIADGRCFLDVDAAGSYMARRRMRVLMIAAFAIVVALMSAGA